MHVFRYIDRAVFPTPHNTVMKVDIPNAIDRITIEVINSINVLHFSFRFISCETFSASGAYIISNFFVTSFSA